MNHQGGAVDTPPRVQGVGDSERVMDMLADGPIYIFDPEAVKDACKHFVSGFPGTTMYAVKANAAPEVISALFANGIRDFDIASLREAQLVHALHPSARLFFMNPVKTAFHISESYRNLGVKTFATDSIEETDKIAACTGSDPAVRCAVRLEVPDGSAAVSISGKFGVEVSRATEICKHINFLGMQPGLTFHVGGQCEDPNSYASAIETVAQVVAAADVEINFLDVGGGFPARFGQGSQWLQPFFDVIRETVDRVLPDLPSTAVFCEPGRALVSDTVEVVSQVTLIRGKDIFLNDGYYGSLSEMPLLLQRVPMKVFRKLDEIGGDSDTFSLFGPTCNNVDALGGGYVLAADIRVGDVIRFQGLGAYSLGLRTNFNGFYSNQIIPVTEAPKFKEMANG